MARRGARIIVCAAALTIVAAASAQESAPARGLPPTLFSALEPVGAHHIINENASATEPARAIAVMIVPEGAPLTTLDAE
jgi:hypothetical protein